jgi:hypothetical protein
LKHEKLCLSHDEQEKRNLLNRLNALHFDYYRCQLAVREVIGKSRQPKVLSENARSELGDSFSYVERFIFQLRKNPEVFNLVVACTPSTSRDLDLLVESFSFSFFEDLMNPENSEVELLKVIHQLIKLEFQRNENITQVFNESVSSVLSKVLVLYTKRRSQRKYLKLLFKK